MLFHFSDVAEIDRNSLAHSPLFHLTIPTLVGTVENVRSFLPASHSFLTYSLPARDYDQTITDSLEIGFSSIFSDIDPCFQVQLIAWFEARSRFNLKL